MILNMETLVSLNKRMEDLWNFNEIIANKMSNLTGELELLKMDLAKIKEQLKHCEQVSP